MSYSSQLGVGQIGSFWIGGASDADNQISPTGFTRRAFGTFGINYDILPAGFTRRAFGSPTLQLTVSFTGFTRRAFGIPQVGNDLHVDGFTRRAFGTPTVQLYVSFTGFTRRAFGTPYFSANTQVDFFQRGISRRAFGTPAFQGADGRLSCYIQGTERGAYLQVETADVSKQLQTTGTAEMHLLVPLAASFRPDMGYPVILQEFGQRKFGGIIETIDEHLIPGGDLFDFTLHCIDWNYIFDRHVVGLAFDPGYVVDHLNKILQLPAFVPEGLSVAGVDPTLFVADAMDFTDIKSGREVLNQFALATNSVWWVDDFKGINFISMANARTSAFSISDDGMQVDSIHLKRSLGNYRNTQWIRSTTNILTQSVTLTDSHTFDGTDAVCPTTYPLTSEPISVKENGVEIKGTPRLFQLKLIGQGPTAYPTSGDGWYWFEGAYGVWYWPSSSRPANGTQLEVRYTGVQTPKSNIVLYRATAEILAMMAATGAGGNFEEVVDFSGFATYDELLKYAQGLVEATAPVPSEFTCNTIEQIEGLGYKVGVNLTKYALNTDYVIQKYTARAAAVDLGKNTHFITSLVLVSAKTLGDWRSYFERILARLHAISAAQPTINPTWSLAFDAGSNISPGLSSGPIGAPWPVTVDSANILGVSVLFKDAPDADIVIDILLDGVSILDGAKIKYRATDSPDQIIFQNLVITTAKRGQVFSGIILATGTIDPGKNGTVTVILGVR